MVTSILFFSEAHPDVIGSNGVATTEGYQSDLAYLKKKVTLILKQSWFIFSCFYLAFDILLYLFFACSYFIILFWVLLSLMLGLI